VLKRSAQNTGRPRRHGSGRVAAAEIGTQRELTIAGLAPGGLGIARDEGRVVLVAGAAPGDRVLARIAGGGAARVLRVIDAGPDRVAAACEHVGTCGGCDWMHLAGDARRREAARIAREVIAHALGRAPGELPEPRVHAAARELGYRTRARFAVRAEPRGVRVGFRAAASRDLVAIDRCVVLDEGLSGVAAALKRALQGARGDGEAQAALGRTAIGLRAPVVELAWRGELPGAVFGALDALVREGTWAGARVLLEGASEPSTFGDPRPVLDGPDGAALVVAEGGFAQPSDEGGRALAQRVAALASPAGQHVVELFAGSGTLSVLLAREAASFLGVEQHEPAVRAARANLAARGLAGKLVAADAEEHAIPARTDVVVLDPPRTGARGAAAALASSRAQRIVYVSCDAATLARDLAVLCGGPGGGRGARPAGAGRWAVASLDVFELFPQTSHFETVVLLRRAGHA
jgi:23S rRNA (uracil1939-C5)-methyltransferase